MPVHQDLGDVDHVERPPCHRPPVLVPDGRKVAPSRWPGPPRHARHPHGELRERGLGNYVSVSPSELRNYVSADRQGHRGVRRVQEPPELPAAQRLGLSPAAR
jgi:hypothetical protein